MKLETVFSGKCPHIEYGMTKILISIRYTTKAFGPIMAKAATLTIVEAENIVPVGSIDPNDVDLPGIFVDRIVPATDEKHIEIKKLREDEGTTESESTKNAAQIQRERIGRRAAKELKQGFYVNLGVGEYTDSHECWVYFLTAVPQEFLPLLRLSSLRMSRSGCSLRMEFSEW